MRREPQKQSATYYGSYHDEATHKRLVVIKRTQRFIDYYLFALDHDVLKPQFSIADNWIWKE